MPRDIKRLLYPKSIAFVGGDECELAIRRTRQLGFSGEIHAIHPKRPELGGIPAVASVEMVGGR
jgi:acyl-CoA synthetase (NDP forming)